MAIVIGILALTLWWSRWVWQEPFDFGYLWQYYQESQWRNPVSQRIISDNELYQVAGVKLVTERDYFVTNPEVPPVGKILYGISSVWLGHPSWATLGLYLGALAAFWWVSGVLDQSRHSRLVGLGLLSSSTLFASQLSQTMMDLPQLLWFLLHLGFVLSLLSSHRPARPTSNRQPWLLAGLAGICLGLFAGTKIAVLAPVILIISLLFLAGQRLWVSAGLLIGTAGLTYMASYGGYFLDHSIWDWLGTQKWMLTFYQQSRVKPIPGMVLVTSLTGWYLGWWKPSIWQPVREWQLSWWLSAVASIGVGLKMAWQVIQKRRLKQFWATESAGRRLYVVLLWFGLIGLMMLIPFWSRYYLLALPLGILLISPWLATKKILVGLVLLLNILQFGLYFHGHPADRLAFMADTWNAGRYADFYNFLTPSWRQQHSRQEFIVTMQALCGLKPPRNRFSLNQNWAIWTTSPQTFTSKRRWHTDQAQLVQQANQWYLEPAILTVWCAP